MTYDSLSGSIKRIVVLTINAGSDLKVTLEEAVRRERITSGAIISGIGTLESMIFANIKSGSMPPEVSHVKMGGPMELLSLGGNISLEVKGDGHESINIHLHAWCSDKEGRVFGGSLGAGNIVWRQVELVIAEFDGLDLRREIDEKKVMKLVLKKR